ncbi:MAG: MFS transporter [Jatrophihabitans sp.]|nr:MAG: MFS transporter [Jatrophihabitans sp.]
MAVSAALPTAARDLHGIAAYGWAFSGFLVASVVGMVLAGQISDSAGPRLPLAVGLVAFAAGLALAGTATWMPQLIAGRVVQGLGSGLLITACYVVIGECYADEVRPRLFAAISSAWVVPSLVGPLLSGAVTQHLSWRWVFLGLLPFVVLGSILMVPTLRGLAPHGRRATALARPGRIVHAIAVAAGIVALERAGQHLGLPSIALAVVGLAALLWGLRTLLPAGTFTLRRGTPAPIAMRGLLAGAFFGVESVIPLALTVQHGFGATEAGLPLACSGVTWAIGSYVQGRPPRGDEDRHRVRLVRYGMALIALAVMLVAVAVHPGAPGWLMYPAWGIAGFGAGLALSTVSVLLLKYTNDRDRGSDSAALQLADATGSAFTTGLAGVLVAAAARVAIGYTAAFTILALGMAALAVLGSTAAGRLRAPAPPGR